MTKKLIMPPNCVDVSKQYRGMTITLVGEMVHKQRMAMAKRLTLNGFKERAPGRTVAIIGSHPRNDRTK
jgi:hypothetical protein